MRKSPVTVQQWVDTLPPPVDDETPSINMNAPENTQPKNTNRKYFTRDLSFQSDDGSSHCSSVESVLELRKPDPEAVLLGLGFGPRRNSSYLSRIPSRFLQPSKVLSQIDLERFLSQLGEAKFSEQHSTPGSPARVRPKTYS